MGKTINFLGIDLESWVASKTINAKKLTNKDLLKLDNGYVSKTLEYLLKTLKKYRQKVTFFVVTRYEELYPGITDRIVKEGHEIGWHTYSHAQLDCRKVLKNELDKSKKYLRKYKVKGIQAPELYFFRDGYSLLKEYGFIYSSSIYGNTEIIYNFDGIYEMPVSVSNENYRPKETEINFPCNLRVNNLLKFGIPFGSSYFWSILKNRYYERKISSLNKRNKAVNLFIHDWQLITPDSKEYENDTSLLRHPLFFPYKLNVAGMFENLLSKFSFQPLINNFK